MAGKMKIKQNYFLRVIPTLTHYSGSIYGYIQTFYLTAFLAFYLAPQLAIWRSAPELSIWHSGRGTLRSIRSWQGRREGEKEGEEEGEEGEEGVVPL